MGKCCTFQVQSLENSVSPSEVSGSFQPCALEHARLLCPWSSPGRNTGRHCHFHLQILQANCSILPDGLCTHLDIPTLHMVYSHGHLETAQKRVSLDGEFVEVPGRKSEAESQDLPTPHSPAQLSSRTRFHQCHSRIPVPPPRPR